MILPEVIGAQTGIVYPFEKEGEFAAANEIDTLVLSGLRKEGIKPANLCSDAVFVRRVYLDLNGSLPEPQEVRLFLNDKGPAKRSELIDRLLERDAFADYWSLKWCDLLRVKAEFPINLWPNAVQAYYRWIHDAVAENMPYDKFALELLTASGSNFRVPQVNFYRAIQGQEPSTIAGAVALTFMGVRLDSWPKEQQEAMATFFSRVAYKGTAEWKEEIVCLDPTPAGPLNTVLPDGKAAAIKSYEDPRAIFAKWLIIAENKWFSRNVVNRVWSWVFGRGIIHEPDDIRADNPAVYPEVLAYLEKELVKSGYDLRHIYRLILNSRTYQQSSIPQSDIAKAEKMFACYPVRRLEAEVLIDALCWLSGTNESYSSAIPEPFSFIPEHQWSIELADGSTSSQFLEMFGRPSRDTGLESERDNQPTDAQRLHLLNSTHVQSKIERSWRLKMIVKNAKGNRRMIANQIYMLILSRYATQRELDVIEKDIPPEGKLTPQAVNDLAWALINSKEFLYRH